MTFVNLETTIDVEEKRNKYIKKDPNLTRGVLHGLIKSVAL